MEAHMSLIPWRNQNLEKRQSTIGDRIRQGDELARKAWCFTVIASNAYREALDLSNEDLETMEHLDAYVVVTLPDNRQVYLVPTHTCGAPYGATWTNLIQARLPGVNMPGIGGGTTFIAALSAEDQKLVCEAINRGNTRIAKGRVWP